MTGKTLLGAAVVAAVPAATSGGAKTTPFLWGVATAAYQVEGGIANNDFDFFMRTSPIAQRVRHNTRRLGGLEANLAPAGEATRSWQPAYYTRDFDNARLLGLNSFRISIEWSRIEPANNAWNDAALDAYARMLDAMRARGLEPIVTLNHFSLPLWVLTPPTRTVSCLGFLRCPNPADPGFRRSLRGWENARVVDEFVEFIRRVAGRLGSRVEWWLTLNEPVGSTIGAGYAAGLWPPGFVADGARAKRALHNLIVAHVRAYDMIHALDRSDADGDGKAARVGLAHAMIWTQPARDTDRDAARRHDYLVNDYFLNAVVNGEEDVNYLNSKPCCTIRDTSSPQFLVHASWKKKVDFIGLNYYRRAYVRDDPLLALTPVSFIGGLFENNLHGHREQAHGQLNDLGWELYPDGLYRLLKRIEDVWDKPVLVTENGIAERTDRHRAPFIVAHVRQIQRAMTEGVDVLGYLHWSLVDNWEWHEGYRREAQFGLLHVERDLAVLQRCRSSCHRTITEGALAYRQLVEESRRGGGGGGPTAAAVESAERRYGALLRTAPPFCRRWKRMAAPGKAERARGRGSPSTWRAPTPGPLGSG